MNWTDVYFTSTQSSTDSGDLIALHGCLQSIDGVNLGDDGPAPETETGRCPCQRLRSRNHCHASRGPATHARCWVSITLQMYMHCNALQYWQFKNLCVWKIVEIVLHLVREDVAGGPGQWSPRRPPRSGSQVRSPPSPRIMLSGWLNDIPGQSDVTCMIRNTILRSDEFYNRDEKLTRSPSVSPFQAWAIAARPSLKVWTHSETNRRI